MDEEFHRNLKQIMPTWPGGDAIRRYVVRAGLTALGTMVLGAAFIAVKFFAGGFDTSSTNCLNTKNPIEERIAACGRAIETEKHKDKERAKLFHARGLAYEANKETDRAIEDLGEAIRLDPNYAVFYNRGILYLRRNDLERAIADFRESVARYNPKADAFHNLGVAYARKNDMVLAIASFTDAIRLDPKFFQARIARGEVFLANKEFERAIADFNEVLRLDANNAAASSGLRRAEALRSQGKAGAAGN